MSKVAAELTREIKTREHHVLLVHGNIYDTVVSDVKTFDDVAGFLSELTGKKYPQCLRYDLFSGIQLERGDEAQVRRDMGIREPAADDENAKLLAALKQKGVGTPSPFPVEPGEAFVCLDRLLKTSTTPTVVFIDYADAVMPNQAGGTSGQFERMLSVALTKWSRDRKIRDNKHLVVLFTRDVGQLEQSMMDKCFQIGQVRVAKPDEQERYDFLKSLSFPKDILTAASKVTAGLSYVELARIAGFCKGANRDTAMAHIFDAKKKVLREEYGDVLEVMETRNGFDSIGGLEKPIAKLKSIVEAMQEGNTTLVPQGTLFMGPPGTGKTVLAEAFAKEAGLNFVKPRDIKNMWVGESERRMTRFINAVRDLAPVVIFIDEFDQNQGQRGSFDGDSGVSRSLFKKMLEVMSDTSLRGKVLWVLATNRPDLIDPAMKRAGRCDLRIPFLPPDEEQLALICQAALKQYPDMRASIKDWSPYAKKCDGYTGADMVEVVRIAWEHANEEGHSAIRREDMDFACEDYRPQMMDRVQNARMSIIAIMECSSKRLLPDNWKTIVEDCLEAVTGHRPAKQADVPAEMKKALDPNFN